MKLHRTGIRRWDFASSFTLNWGQSLGFCSRRKGAILLREIRSRSDKGWRLKRIYWWKISEIELWLSWVWSFLICCLERSWSRSLSSFMKLYLLFRDEFRHKYRREMLKSMYLCSTGISYLKRLKWKLKRWMTIKLRYFCRAFLPLMMMLRGICWKNMWRNAGSCIP